MRKGGIREGERGISVREWERVTPRSDGENACEGIRARWETSGRRTDGSWASELTGAAGLTAAGAERHAGGRGGRAERGRGGGSRTLRLVLAAIPLPERVRVRVRLRQRLPAAALLRRVPGKRACPVATPPTTYRP